MDRSLPSVEQILGDSAELNRLHEDVHSTVKKREVSAASRQRWIEACRRFRDGFHALAFPGGYERYASFLGGDDTGLEAALRFLEADPIHFRSGYMKEALWRRLARMELDDATRARLEQATLRRLARPISRDYWYQCRAMARIAREDFWRDVMRASAAEDDELGPAHCLAAYLEGEAVGNGIRRRARDRWRGPWLERLRRRFER